MLGFYNREVVFSANRIFHYNSGLSLSTKYTHSLCVRVVEFLNVKPGGTFRNNCDFSGGFSYTLYCILRSKKKKKVDLSRLAEWVFSFWRSTLPNAAILHRRVCILAEGIRTSLRPFVRLCAWQLKNRRTDCHKFSILKVCWNCELTQILDKIEQQ